MVGWVKWQARGWQAGRGVVCVWVRGVGGWCGRLAGGGVVGAGVWGGSVVGGGGGCRVWRWGVVRCVVVWVWHGAGGGSFVNLRYEGRARSAGAWAARRACVRAGTVSW